MLSEFRSVLHDALSPGRLTLLALSHPHGDAATIEKPAPSDRTGVAEGLDARQLQTLRQLMIENARLRRDLKHSRQATAMAQLVDPASSLTSFETTPAKVISSSGLPGLLRELVISAGKSAGITRSELVVDGGGAIIDVGTDAGVAAGDRVLSGACVIGRVEKTGRWVSMVQPVTAAEFRAQVQLLRASDDGMHFGAVGMLEGTGTSECRLTGISYTDSVTVGDTVVSADINGARGPRLFFGTVTSAEFLAGGQWDVRIQPGLTLAELDQVRIVRMSLQTSGLSQVKIGVVDEATSPAVP
ncbi:MAG: rod shape-determining protein MreC [Planctomycetaceae bacterium]|nr:rod shape-determining protein MreC [Planctomycetaceae bacterium]